VARDEKGEPVTKGYPFVSSIAPDKVPPVAGLDNSKIKVMEDHGAVAAGKQSRTTLESDLELIAKSKESGGKVEEKLEANLNGLKLWWEQKGKPNYETDKPKIEEGKLFGGKQALLYTAAVPATMAVCYLLLILIFKMGGGYKQHHLGPDT
jgi:hypothetical protein